MSLSTSLTLPSGLEIAQPLAALFAFCREEYAYYDAIPSFHSHRVEPVDVLATVAMNSFVNSATAVRSVHRGLAQQCDSALAVIPEDAELLTCDESLLARVRELLRAAVEAKGVLIPVATKVLHRKRRALIPMLDSVVIEHYRPGYVRKMQDKSNAAKRDEITDRAMEVLSVFRTDLRAARDELDILGGQLAGQGYELSRVRILELLVWMQTEPRQYYIKHAMQV